MLLDQLKIKGVKHPNKSRIYDSILLLKLYVSFFQFESDTHFECPGIVRTQSGHSEKKCRSQVKYP